MTLGNHSSIIHVKVLIATHLRSFIPSTTKLAAATTKTTTTTKSTSTILKAYLPRLSPTQVRIRTITSIRSALHRTTNMNTEDIPTSATATTGSREEQRPDDYISFASESDSDLEVDLYTRPPKRSTPAVQPKVPKHFRKSNDRIYDNISVYAPPDSNLIFRCSQKRADWYLSRNLARVLTPSSIHLTFTPGGQGRANDPYYLEDRENKCVICGRETCEVGATMLHVVPEQYRKWFPLQMKSHASHDIVVACPECNATWDREAAVVRKKIVGIYNVPLEGVGWIKDYAAGAAKRAAGAIVADWNRRWNEHQVEQARVAAVPESDTTLTSTSQSQGRITGGIKKQLKAKKQAVIPPERIRALEQTVLDWWMQSSNNASNGAAWPRNGKRESEESGDPNSSEGESRKRLKQESESDSTSQGLPLIESTTPSSMTDTTMTPALPDVPLPPPGSTTVLEPRMLQEALIAEGLYKAEDYKEHGQLVMARVMASSPEYHDDKDISSTLLQSWKDAQPLCPPVEGWTDVAAFVRSWRQAFLERTKPQHMSSEWKVENPIN